MRYDEIPTGRMTDTVTSLFIAAVRDLDRYRDPDTGVLNSTGQTETIRNVYRLVGAASRGETGVRAAIEKLGEAYIYSMAGSPSAHEDYSRMLRKALAAIGLRTGWTLDAWRGLQPPWDLREDWRSLAGLS